MTESSGTGAWLLVSVSTSGAANTLRVQVWRKLKSLGALYVQQSVCLLPDREPVRTQIRRLAGRVREQGGHARVLTIRFDDPAEEQGVIGEFNTARDGEYAELRERIPALHTELEHELARGNTTYAEVEESEADLDRFRAWLAKIAARDYFDAPGAAPAREAVEGAAQALARFEQAALHADTTAPVVDRAGLRIVGQS